MNFVVTDLNFKTNSSNSYIFLLKIRIHLTFKWPGIDSLLRITGTLISRVLHL